MVRIVRSNVTRKRPRCIMDAMRKAPKDTRSAAEKARDTADIIGSWKHEGYVPTPEAEAVHQRVETGELSTEQAIEIFRQRALKQDAAAAARKRRPARA